jgi:putative membrane-bound dehydrogenase-like protein
MRLALCAIGLLLILVLAVEVEFPAADKGWLELSQSLDVWKKPHGKWFFADEVEIDPADPRRLRAQRGKGILVNGPTGRSNDLFTKQYFGDVEVHVEFLIPRGSNSGIKFHGHYEIQIADTQGKQKPSGEDCGGIYPRAENSPRYHHIDQGVPPLVNAARRPGEWQTLDVTFHAPRFDAAGKKTANARIVKAMLNGKVIHENVELRWPTGANWRNKEMATGPLMLQGDHGPVAFRNVRVKPLKAGQTAGVAPSSPTPLPVSTGAVGNRKQLAIEGKFPAIVNTQNPREAPPTPAESLRKITVPAGFQVTLFAGEPDVQQPINMAIDDRGRVWVAECYTYAGGGFPGVWDKKPRDRIIILEDTDHDGRFDKRTVFWDEGRNLSSITLGFGGVWALAAPNLLFIPMQPGKDEPSGPPQIVLDGFVVGGVGHNIVNGLTWGPDGWLYGRHGIQDTSLVGPPGTPDARRVRLNCSIWRYHPTRKVFEVVTTGTTNPWGLDYDDHGQMFFTNNVNGHLWHVIPGAHFKRMYGEDFNLHAYELIGQHADHDHWDSGQPWMASRDGVGKHGQLGGGHSHCGGMIYLGDNFPPAYRNTIFMCNTHGHRLNNDRLVRSGSGYVGKHGEDLFFANDPWFRGTDLRYGPDGGVYISDWTDLGECHDNDGVHRTSGRIYKVTYGTVAPPTIGNVATLSNHELVGLQLHRNEFYVRAARRNLQERAAAGDDMKVVHAELDRMFREQNDVTRKLRALWALHVTGGTTEERLRGLLAQENEHLRVWAIKLLVDRGESSEGIVEDFTCLAKKDPSGLVRLFLASALQRLPAQQRDALATALLSHAEDQNDHNLPLMLWYGVEPLAAAEPSQAVHMARDSRIPLVRRLMARRLTEDLEKTPGPLNKLLEISSTSSAEFQRDVLKGMSEALRGWRKARSPQAWAALSTRLADSPSQEVRGLVRDLGVVFGDGRALAELRQIVKDTNAAGEARRSALAVLIENRPPDLVSILRPLVSDRSTAAMAIRGLAACDYPDTPKLVLRSYHQLQPPEKSEAISTLTSRPEYARALLDAMAHGTVPRSDVSAFHARQIRSLGNKELDKQLAEVWGDIRGTRAELKQQIERYKKRLTPERLKMAQLSSGRALFNQTCASCHSLYGEGQKIGPDLTGSGRHNLDYLLENIIDPSAVVPADFRMSVVSLKNGRVVTGCLVGPRDGRTVAIQTPTERVVLERSEIDDIQGTAQSLMPDGLLNTLNEDQVRDLIAYLMTNEQVPLPPQAR